MFSNRKNLTLLILLAVSSVFSTASISTIYLDDEDDSTWLAKPGGVGFTIEDIFGALGENGDLIFGIYDPDDMSKQEVFPAGYAVGDTNTLFGLGSDPFGFYLENISTDFGGPNTFYSDSALNPGDAMLAEDLGGNDWSLTFEDWILPITPDGWDLRVTVTNLMPETLSVPEAPTLLMLGLGLVGLASSRRMRRRKKKE